MVYFLCKAYDSDRQNCYFALSLPVRGAWIEIPSKRSSATRRSSLPVRGAWIEMARPRAARGAGRRRSPCGERGLKWDGREGRGAAAWSLPVRGAWIEMAATRAATRCACMSLPVRGAWIEIPRDREGQMLRQCRSPCGERGLKLSGGAMHDGCPRSLPVRGAWIEMAYIQLCMAISHAVAPRAGSVD